MTHADDVASLTDKIAAADEKRANLVTSRDVAMAKAKASGATWAALKAASRLSLRGAQLAVDRGRKHPAFKA